MGNKNKTVSFRVNEEKFAELREVAEAEDLSLSSVFREYVDAFVEHRGQVSVVPEESAGDDEEFPPTVEVPKEFVREQERLELENEYLELELEHLREQLAEHKAYIEELKERLETDDDVIYLEELDGEDADEEETFRIG